MRRERELDERFADWVDGRLAPRDLARLEAEFEVNRDLRARAEEYRQSVMRLREALAEPGPQVDIADRVLARIADDPRPSRGVMPFLASFAAAAAVILMFFALNTLEPGADKEFETARREADAPEPDPAAAPARPGLDRVTTLGEGLAARDAQPAREILRSAERVADAPAAGAQATEPPAEVQVSAEARAAGKAATPDDEARQQAQVTVGEREQEEQSRIQPDLLEKTGEVARVSGGEAPGEAKNEIDTWLRGVVGEDAEQDDKQDVGGVTIADQLTAERANPGSGLATVPGDAPARSPVGSVTAPVVVINLPDGQDLDTGAMIPGQAGAVGGGPVPEPGRADRNRRVAAPRPESGVTVSGVDSRSLELKDQKLQELIDLSQVPTSNVLPADVDEIDPGDLPLLQGAVGYDNRQQGRGFLVRGERQQVASFLRQMSDWGRARGGGVAVTQVAETVVQQAQLPARLRSQLGRAARVSQAQAATDEIEILVLFQTGQKNR